MLPPLQVHAVAKVKAGLSSLLMSSAENLATMSHQIEAEEAGLDWPQPRQRDNLGYAAGAIMMASSALEASVNEIYLQAVDKHTAGFPKLDEREVTALARLWSPLESSKAAVLLKHQVALEVVGREAFATGEEPYQSAAALMKLRNALVHFKPEWEDELAVHKLLHAQLSGKFAENQLSAASAGGMLWFPYRCLGAGCARWACETVTELHRSFAKRLGIAPRLPVFPAGA